MFFLKGFKIWQFLVDQTRSYFRSDWSLYYTISLSEVSVSPKYLIWWTFSKLCGPFTISNYSVFSLGFCCYHVVISDNPGGHSIGPFLLIHLLGKYALSNSDYKVRKYVRIWWTRWTGKTGMSSNWRKSKWRSPKKGPNIRFSTIPAHILIFDTAVCLVSNENFQSTKTPHFC